MKPKFYEKNNKHYCKLQIGNVKIDAPTTTVMAVGWLAAFFIAVITTVAATPTHSINEN